MQERWFVTLGIVPMLIGVLALILLRRPEETRVVLPPTAAGASAPKVAPGEAALDGDAGYLGVIVAGHTADLGAEIGGSVVRVFVREGARVKAGEALVYIDPAAASSDARMAEAELAQQMSVVARAEAEHVQASDLLSRLIAAGTGIPEQTLVTARAREASSRAALEEAKAGIDVGKARIHREQARIKKHTITAPFDGVVVTLGVDPGDVVSAGQIVARVISDEHDVRFAVPPSARAMAQVGTAIAVRPAGRSPRDASAPRASGVVTEVLPEVDAASGLQFLRARLLLDPAQAGAFVAGTTVRVSDAREVP